MAESTLAPKESLRPRGRRTPIGASRPGDPATRGTKALRPMADLPSAAALGKMTMEQLKRLLDAAQSSEERNVIQEAIQAIKIGKIQNDPKNISRKAAAKAKTKNFRQAKTGSPMMSEGGLTQPTKNQTGLKKLPTAVRNKMGFFKSGGMAPSGNNDMRKGGMFK